MGSVIASCAFLTRQLGIMIPVGISLYYLYQRQHSFVKIIKISLIPVLVTILYFFWFNYIHHSNWANQYYVLGSTLKHVLNFRTFLKDIFLRSYGALIYIGLFLLPIGAAISNIKCSRFTLIKKICLSLIGTSFIIFVIFFKFLPYFDNTLHYYGLGTITVIDGIYYKKIGFISSRIFWCILTVLSVYVIIKILYCLFANQNNENKHINSMLLYIIPWILMHLMSFLGMRYFDRYLLVLLPPAIFLGLTLVPSQKIRQILPNIVLAAIILFSLFATRDYFAWNNAKWKLGSQAERYGIPREKVSNGFDWTGSLIYEKNMGLLKSQKPVKEIGEWDWLYINDFEAIVSYSPILFDRSYLLSTITYETPFSRKPVTLYLWRFPPDTLS